MQNGTSAPARPLQTSDRVALFGRFAYKATPVPGNPEQITVTDPVWAKNLVKTPLPAEIAAAEGADFAWFHKLVLPKFLELVKAWVDAQVIGDVIQWSGAYAARFTRGRPGVLSAHAFGSAFDINAAYNRLGMTPAGIREKGTVLRLVPFAEARGWVWGGRFSRPDGMHFELAKL
jgi:hypothetical protein